MPDVRSRLAVLAITLIAASACTGSGGTPATSTGPAASVPGGGSSPAASTVPSDGTGSGTALLQPGTCPERIGMTDAGLSALVDGATLAVTAEAKTWVETNCPAGVWQDGWTVGDAGGPGASGSGSGSEGSAQAGMTLDCRPRGHDNYRINDALAIDPSNPDVLWVGVEYKGIFRSADGGATWERRDTGIGGYPMTDRPDERCIQELGRIVVDPTDPNRVLAIRVETPGTIDMRFSEHAGLWETVDAGASWHQLIKPGVNASGSHALALDPRDPRTVYYGVNDGYPSWTEAAKERFVSRGVLYRTRDGGAAWEELPTGTELGLRALQVFVDPSNSDRISLVTLNKPDEGPPVPGDQWGLLGSTDGGQTWTKLTDGVPAADRAFTGAAVAPTNFDHAVLMGSRPEGEQHSFATLNGGRTWTTTSTYVYVATYDPHDPNGLRLLGYNPFAPGGKLLRSTDGGRTWKPFAPLPAEIDGSDRGVRVSTIVFDPTRPDIVYLGASEARAWRSTDGGRTWTAILDLDRIGGAN